MIFTKDITILGINGSPHKNGICAQLLKQALKVAEREGANNKIFHLVDDRIATLRGEVEILERARAEYSK